MKKEVFKKRPYKTPECKKHFIEMVNLICVTVLPKVPGSTEEDWKSEEEAEGGEDEI